MKEAFKVRILGLDTLLLGKVSELAATYGVHKRTRISLTLK